MRIYARLALHGRVEKNASDHRIRRALRDLGLDLSRYSVRDRNDSTVSDGRRALPFSRINHVCDCLVARHSKSSWANWRTSLIIGACLLLAGNGGVTISEEYIDSGLAAVIVAIVPIYILLLSWATGMAPKPAPIMWLALVGGFIGVGILFGPALHFTSNDGRHPAIGISILLVSSFIWSVGSLYSRVAKHAASPFLTAAQQMLCGGMLLLFVGIATGELRRLHPGSISMLSFGSFIYLVIIGAVVGYTAYIWLLRHCEPAKSPLTRM